jgi:glycosyltransferase involved in cell wall biosynthesis
MDNAAPTRPLRVLMLINLFLPEVFAGGEQQCLRLSRALPAHGIEPVILTSRSNPETPEHEVMDGIPVHRLWSPTEPQKGGRHLGASLIWMRKVARWIDAHRDEIDLIHCHHAKLNAWVGLRAARRIGVPCAVKIGSAGPNYDFRSLEKKRFVYGRLAARDIRGGADAFIATSAEMMRDLRDDGIAAERIHRIGNGIDLPSAIDGATRARLRAAMGVSGDERLILFSGRMERQKNVETLLKAFAGSLAQGPRARLLLLGDGSLLQAHRALSDRLGLGDRVRFTGRVDTVSDHLGAADLFVLPARAEGMSNALLEAMAHGLPQIVSKVSGNTDLVIEGRTGWFYAPPEDARALARVLAQALACPSETLAAMAGASRHRVQEGYAMDSVAARHAALYRSLIAAEAAYADVA